MEKATKKTNRTAKSPVGAEQVSNPVNTTPKKAQTQSFTPEPNTYIVRNITPSILCISDLGLTFNPLQVIDLTYEDNTKTNASKDLRMAVKQGQLMRISAKERDMIEDMQIEAEQARQIKEQKERRRQLVDVDDRAIEAEVLNLNAAESRNRDEEVSTAGHANDPLTYANAYSAAVAEAASQGKYLDAETFHNMVQQNPGVIEQYIRSSRGRGTTSGASRRGRATVVMPPMDGQNETSVVSMNMSNFARDHRLAGAGEFGLGTAEVGFGEEIDLADED